MSEPEAPSDELQAVETRSPVLLSCDGLPIAYSTFYTGQGNLLQREVEARHVAEAFVMLARAERTTGHVMTVDGGNIEAALR